MMNRDKWLIAADTLGRNIIADTYDMEELLKESTAENPWFTTDEIQRRFLTISKDYLNKDKLSEWLEPNSEAHEPKRIGLILAGNLPAVGFHDCLAVLMMNHQLKIKLSHKDRHLIPFLFEKLFELAGEEISNRIEYVDKLSGFDAVIATGSDDSVTHFKKYFANVPHLLRGHRTSAAVLTGDETDQDLLNLGSDVFEY
jgi:hypothetical protein